MYQHARIETGGRDSIPQPGKSQVAICFLCNNEMTPTPIASRGRAMRPSMKYVNKKFK